VIDEIGFVPLHKDAAELLFPVISDCYKRKSLIITSNLEFPQWNTVFGDNRLTAALIDRLIHHCPHCDFHRRKPPPNQIYAPPESGKVTRVGSSRRDSENPCIKISLTPIKKRRQAI